VVHAPDTRILLFNKTALKLLGLSDDQMLGKMAIDPAWHFIHETGRLMPLEEYPVMQVLANQRPLVNFVLGVNRPVSDVLTWVLVNAFPEFDDQKQLRQIVVTFLDITERKRAEAEREKLQSQLTQSQKMDSIGQLAGGVAHDFNNILAATMMQLSCLQRNPKLDRETQESLQELMEQSKRAANLTRQLLMFSRRSVLEIKTLDLNEVVGNLLKMLGRLIGEHIDLVFSRRAGLPSVEADPGMIEQVLLNLCVNARDAMPKGGTLTIGLEAVLTNEGRIQAPTPVQQGCFVCLSVADTGSGMDEATLQKIFEPFFTTKEVGKGTGLGLATVHGIVGQHKGWVEVESKVGQGATFRVFLPAATNQPFDPVQAEQQPALRGSETILLVEDESSVRRSTAQALRFLGYAILEAANGREALEVWKASEHQVDLVLTDMVMPGGMTGLDVAQELLKMKPDLKVLIASGYSPEMVDQRLLAAKHIVRIQKPCPLEALSQIIRQCLDREDPE
jgi:signal transduction histidine kinase